MLFWRAFSEIDKVLGVFFSIWRSLVFTCWLVEVMSVTVALALEFIIIWAEFRAILPGKRIGNSWSEWQKVVYVWWRVHYSLKGLENRAGRTHGHECFCWSQMTEGKRTPILGCENPSIGQNIVEGFKCINKLASMSLVDEFLKVGESASSNSTQCTFFMYPWKVLPDISLYYCSGPEFLC